jgi:hypothetical protein
MKVRCETACKPFAAEKSISGKNPERETAMMRLEREGFWLIPVEARDAKNRVSSQTELLLLTASRSA